MKKVNLQIGLILFLFIFSFGVRAQSLQNLSLADAKQFAFQYNRTLQKSGLSVAEAKSAKWQAIAAGLPHATASYSYQNSMDYEVNLGMAAFTLEPTQNAQVQVTQLLFNGSYWVGIQMAEIAKNMSVISLKKSELDIAKDVTVSYQTILISNEMHKILRSNYENMKGLLAKTKEMVTVGALESTSADQLSVQVASMENAIKQNERQIELAENLFRLQLGLDVNTYISLSDSIGSFVNDAEVASLLLEPFVLNNSYDIQLLNQNLSLAKKQVNIAYSAALPTISAYYNYTHKIATSGFDMQPPHVVGLSASLPLFTSFETTSKIKQAKYKLKSAELDVKNVNEQLLIQEKQLRFNLKNAYESYKIQKENIEVSNRVFSNISLKYEQGAASGLDLTTANNNLLSAQSNYISATMQLLTAENDLKNLLGKK